MTPSGVQASSMFEIKMFAQSCQRGTFVAKVTKSVFCVPGQGEDWLKIFVVNCVTEGYLTSKGSVCFGRYSSQQTTS